LPTDLQFDRSRKLFTDLLQPELWLTLLVFTIFITALIKYRKRISPLVMFLITWFFIDLLPVSQIFAAIGTQPGYISLAEHFLYTPSIPAFALIVLGLRWLYEKNQIYKKASETICQLGLAGLFAFYFLMTIQHNIYSSNEIAMLERTLSLYPENSRIQNSLAIAYGRAGLPKEAEQHFRKALDVYPNGTWARIGLGKALCDQGRYWEGLQEYELIQDPGRFRDVLRENIGLTYEFLRRDYEKKLQNDPASAINHYGLGIVYSKTSHVPEAVRHFEEAVKLNSDFTDAWFNLASVYEVTGRLPEAAKGYERFLSLHTTTDAKEAPLQYYAYSHLALIYDKLADSAKARKYNSLAAQMGKK
jgi:tetratricopeptide (TPR) repeat protein